MPPFGNGAGRLYGNAVELFARSSSFGKAAWVVACKLVNSRKIVARDGSGLAPFGEDTLAAVTEAASSRVASRCWMTSVIVKRPTSTSLICFNSATPVSRTSSLNGRRGAGGGVVAVDEEEKEDATGGLDDKLVASVASASEGVSVGTGVYSASLASVVDSLRFGFWRVASTEVASHSRSN